LCVFSRITQNYSTGFCKIHWKGGRAESYPATLGQGTVCITRQLFNSNNFAVSAALGRYAL